jgi:hypothetical protein
MELLLWDVAWSKEQIAFSAWKEKIPGGIRGKVTAFPTFIDCSRVERRNPDQLAMVGDEVELKIEKFVVIILLFR